MSDFIAAEWLTPGPSMGIGAVLVLDQHDGFKCYVGAQDAARNAIYPDNPRDNSAIEWDIARIRKYGAKVSVEVAEVFFRNTMIDQWLKRNMWDKLPRDYRYDGKNYRAGQHPQEVK